MKIETQLCIYRIVVEIEQSEQTKDNAERLILRRQQLQLQHRNVMLCPCRIYLAYFFLAESKSGRVEQSLVKIQLMWIMTTQTVQKSIIVTAESRNEIYSLKIQCYSRTDSFQLPSKRIIDFVHLCIF